MKRNVLILGATSDIAVALARQFAKNDDGLTLAARDPVRLSEIRRSLEKDFKKASVSEATFDALKFDRHESFYASLETKPDIVIAVFGYLGDQNAAQQDWQECHKIIDTNFTGAVSILNIVASDFEKRGSGVIVGISSVAGERGRARNYFYGSAKAGFTNYLSGLRSRLFRKGVDVLTVKPGYVKTRMIEQLDTPGVLTATSEQVAVKIFTAIGKRKKVLYSQQAWYWIMLGIKNIPESLFMRMKV